MAYEGLMSQIANPQMADIAGALDFRQKRILEEQKRQKDAKMKELIAQAIPGLRPGSVLSEMAAEDPERYMMFSKAMGIPMNEGEKIEQMAQDVRQISKIAQRDPEGALAFVNNLTTEREKIGLDVTKLRQWQELATQDFGKAQRAIGILDESLNSDLIAAENLQERKMKLQERGLDIQEKKINQDASGQADSYYQPIQTADGLYAFNARTGQVEQALTPGGGAITPAQVDVGLQGQLAGAKTGASEREKVAIDKEKAIATSDKLQVGIDEARKLIPQATGSMLGAARDATLSAAGIATDKSKAASQLETLAGWMVANVPRMEGPQSNFDVENYKTMAAKVGNRSAPVEERIAALDTLEMLHAKYRGINSPKGGDQAQKKAGGVEMVDANGNRAMVYPDGSFEEL